MSDCLSSRCSDYWSIWSAFTHSSMDTAIRMAVEEVMDTLTEEEEAVDMVTVME